jgi:hypothetical protein
MNQASGNTATAELEAPAPAESAPAPFERFRRRFDTFRGEGDAIRSELMRGDVDLELTVMLLREENARLKAERHRPAGVGAMVDRLRVIAADQEEDQAVQDVWGLLGECLTIHEGLYRACGEVQTAITAVEKRLTQLGASIVDSATSQDGTGGVARRSAKTAEAAGR